MVNQKLLELVEEEHERLAVAGRQPRELRQCRCTNQRIRDARCDGHRSQRVFERGHGLDARPRVEVQHATILVLQRRNDAGPQKR
jgi:hypothetical protein